MDRFEAIPAPLRQYAGRVSDVDSHEMMPLQEWARVLGTAFLPYGDAWIAGGEDETSNRNHPNVPGFPGDVEPIGGDIGDVKGCRAPGATDMTRRTAVMDAMGISRQLMFAGAPGFQGLMLQLNGHDRELWTTITKDRRELGKHTVNLYNDWLVEAARVSDRLRPVAVLHTENVDELLTTTRSLLDRGIRAVQLPAGVLPGGKSPADPALDPFWSMLTDTDSIATLHIGGEATFFETRDWGEAPAFKGFRNLGEFTVDPWTLSVIHLPSQNFVSTMLAGGVFERHPSLRFGVIEVGAYWFGPMLQTLDMWYENAQLFKSPGTYQMPNPPSFYARRNIRLTPFVFEDAGKLIEQYDLGDVLCFSSDYPHVEGGTRAMQRFYDSVVHLGDEAVEKFFVTNGSYLLPD